MNNSLRMFFYFWIYLFSSMAGFLLLFTTNGILSYLYSYFKNQIGEDKSFILYLSNLYDVKTFDDLMMNITAFFVFAFIFTLGYTFMVHYYDDLRVVELGEDEE